MAANQVDFKILPSDQFSVYSPQTRSDKVITYFTLLSKLRGDILSVGQEDDPNNIVSAFYINTGNVQTLHLVKADGSEVTASNSFAGTVTSVDMSVPTGFSISGNPITTSGTLAVGFASGYSLPTDAIQATWTTAYNRSLTSAAVTGTSTKTLTLNQQDGGTITASWSDIDTGLTSVGLTMPAAFSVANSPLTANGTLAVTAAGLSSQYIRGDGQLANFPTPGGGGSSVNYYLNGSVSQGTFGGDTYYELSKTPIAGAGTNFTKTSASGDGYIASFITDANDPDQINIPGGNWNLEFYFNSSSSGGSPAFYGELYKVSVSNVFTLIASGSVNPESITGGTTVDQYYTSIAVPQTALLSTDRLAIRVYVIVSGKNITLHTENSNFSEVITTFSTGLNSLNGLSDQVQYFAVGTSGTDFAISSSVDTHTFNLPTASAANRGALSSADWTTFNSKQGAITLTTTGTTGAATFISNTLNIPSYTDQFVGTVTSVNLTAGTGITVSGGPITTSGSITVNNSDRGSSQNIFKNFAVAGQSTIVADTNDDTLTIVAGSGVTLTTNDTTDTLTISASGSGGTVTSVGTSAPLTGGPITATGTIGITQSGVSTDGYLSSTDWNTFNNKQSTLLFSGPLVNTSGTVSIPVATTSVSGYLNNTDWTTFNSKQNAITLTTTGTTGAATLIGATLNIPNYADQFVGTVTSVNMSVPTGFAISGNPITTSGTLAVAFDTGYSLPTNASQTTWNTAYNDSITAFAYNTSTAVLTLTQQDAGTLTATVTLQPFTTSNLAEGTNLYYTDTRARLALSAGTGITYDSATGIITNSAPDQTVVLTGGTGITTSGTYPSFTVTNSDRGSSQNIFKNIAVAGQSTIVADVNDDTLTVVAGSGVTITTNDTTDTITISATGSGGSVTSVGTTAPITGGTITTTGTIGITQSGAAADGYLSSTDWNTFNNKQNALTNPVTGTGTTNYVSKFTSSSAIGNSQIFDDGTSVGIGTASPTQKLEVNGVIESYYLEFKPVVFYDFNSDTTADWGKGNSTLSVPNDSVTRYTSTGADSNINKSFNFDGGQNQIIRIRYKVVTGPSGGGEIFYANSQHGYSGSYFKGFTLVSDGAWHTLVLDMSNLTSGGTDWIDYNVTAIRFDLTNVSGVAIDIDWISIGGNGYGTQYFENDVAFMNGNVGIGTTAPSQILHVSGNIRVTGAYYDSGNSAGTSGQILSSTATGTSWIAATGGSVTSVDLTAGTGISVSGGPITTSGSITVTNTAPDQTVVLTAGTGISTSGTYPSFTVTNSAPDQTVVLTASTGITTSGTYPNFTIANSAPDQTVVLTGGTGITTSGTYPSFTVTNSAPDQTVALTAGTGISISGTYPSFTITNTSAGGGTITGSGTTNYVSKFTGTSAIGDSAIYDSSGNVVIGSTVANPVASASPAALTLRKFTSGTASTVISSSYYLGVGGNEFTLNSYRLIGLGYSETSVSATYPAYIGYQEKSTAGYTFGDLIFGTRATTGAADNPVERMRITNDGNVGIGTTAPYGRLELNGSGDSWTTAPAIRMWDSLNSKGWLVGNVNNITAGDFYIRTLPSVSGNPGSGQQEFTIKHATGNVGIGITAPASILHVTSSGANSYSSTITKGSNMKGIVNTTSNNADDMIGIYFATGTAEGAHWSGITGSRSNSAVDWSTQLNFYTHDENLSNLNDATQKMVIKGNGSVGIGNTAPNQKLELSVGNAVTGGLRINYAASATAEGMDITYLNSGNTTTSFDSRYNSDSAVMQFRMKTASTAVNAMTILGSGNVGINTTAPGDKLDVSGEVVFGSGTEKLSLGSASIGFNRRVATGAIYTNTAFAYQFQHTGSTTNTSDYLALQVYNTAGTQVTDRALVVNGLGNVGIGTTAPGTKLQIDDTSSPTIRLNASSASGGAGSVQFYNQLTQKWNLTTLATTNDFALYNNGGTNSFNLFVSHSSGNVGIGTTTPLKKLVVTTGNNTNSSNNKSDALAYFGGGNDNADSQNISFPNPSITDGSIPGMSWWSPDVMFGRYKFEAFWSIKETHGGALGNSQKDIIRAYFYDSGGFSYIDKVIIPNGNVGINNTSPSYKLDVTGDARINTGALGVNIAPSATDGRIDASNDIVAFSSSDLRLKENIKPIENALEKVKSLTGVEFDWKPELKHAHGYEGHDTGVIAQEVQEVMPTAIRTNDTGYLAVRYEKLIGLLIEANKELAARVEELESKFK